MGNIAAQTAGSTPMADLPDECSARATLTPGQRSLFMAMATALAAGLLLHPGATLGALHLAGLGVFASLIAWRALLLVFGAGWMGVNQYRPPLVPTAWRLPRYTVMVALYRERAALPGLVAALAGLDYARGCIEVLLLIESDDGETGDALAGLNLPEHFRIIRVPPGHPRTKPRALNFGLMFATGDFLVIYDAEDRPDRKQLRAALASFWHGPADLACVQAPLKAYNARESWLASQWALEYLGHFHLLLPAMSRLRLPVPLGGTSNHFRTEHLRAIGGWDAFNVTEDADLGVRLALSGKRTGMIHHGTLEEAPLSLKAWTAQRSRWIKGHLQTWLVAMRRPGAALRELGAAGFLALQLQLAGSVLSSLLHGLFAIWMLAGLAFPAIAFGVADIALFAAGLGVNTVLALRAARATRVAMGWAVLTQPLYWPLHTLAALRAVWSLARRPHFWAKTEHGVTGHDIRASAAVFAE